MVLIGEVFVYLSLITFGAYFGGTAMKQHCCRRGTAAENSTAVAGAEEFELEPLTVDSHSRLALENSSAKERSNLLSTRIRKPCNPIPHPPPPSYPAPKHNSYGSFASSDLSVKSSCVDLFDEEEYDNNLYSEPPETSVLINIPNILERDANYFYDSDEAIQDKTLRYKVYAEIKK